MKQYILKVAQDLEQGTITEDKARRLLLGLFGVSGSLQPLTINNVSKMLDKVSKETWIAVQGDERGWKEWWKNRNKLYLNSNDRQRSADLRWAGFLALHFNRSTTVEPTYKLSNEAPNPAYCKCAVIGWRI